MISTYGAQQWIGAMFGVTALPATLYVALCTDEPGVDWDGVALQTIEPVDSAYARQPIDLNGTDWLLDDNAVVYNNTALTYGAPTVDWTTITHYALLDDPVAGNLWSADLILQELDTTIGVPPVIDAGSLFFTLIEQTVSIEGD